MASAWSSLPIDIRTPILTAVDNVFEQFMEVNECDGLLQEDWILHVATDSPKVGKALQSYTVDAWVEGYKQKQQIAQEGVRAS